MVIVRAVLLLLLLSFGGGAFALIQPEDKYTMGLGPYQSNCGASTRFYAGTPEAVPAATATGLTACAGFSVTWTGKHVTGGGTYGTGEIYAGGGFAYSDQIVKIAGTCPAGSTAVAGGCQCNTGNAENGGQCVNADARCAADIGKVGVINFTEGYTRTPDEGDRMAVVSSASGGTGINYPPADGKFCHEGCTVSAQTAGPGTQPWVSQFANAQGLYRRSIDFPTINLGTSCTANDSTDKAIKADTPPPPCPGAVGEVNGRTACVGTAEKPVYAQPLGQPPAPAIAGNPTSGPKPATGDGSGTGSAGRTPTAGDGSNGGGPAAAGVGGKGGGAGGTAAGAGTGAGTGTGSSGTGTVPKPGTGEEQAACGAPGQPKCAIDETGTPKDGKDVMDPLKAAQDKNAADSKSAIEAAASMQGPSWTFSFQLPTGCSAYSVASFKGLTFSMNPCTYQSTIHDLMSMVWAAATAMCLIAMVGKTIREA